MTDTSAKLPLPGMAAISLWMLGLALMGVAGVLTGHYPPGGARVGILILCSVFALAGLGLMRLRRWGWALTLGAAFLSMCFGCYSLFRFHQVQWVVMAAINLVFFLYLVRPEVVERLR
jgi:multisubunit Na+/H+ antiporter MnhB subunit